MTVLAVEWQDDDGRLRMIEAMSAQAFGVTDRRPTFLAGNRGDRPTDGTCLNSQRPELFYDAGKIARRRSHRMASGPRLGGPPV